MAITLLIGLGEKTPSTHMHSIVFMSNQHRSPHWEGDPTLNTQDGKGEHLLSYGLVLDGQNMTPREEG